MTEHSSILADHIDAFVASNKPQAYVDFVDALFLVAAKSGKVQGELAKDSGILLSIGEESYIADVHPADARLRSLCARICVVASGLGNSQMNPYRDKATVYFPVSSGVPVALVVTIENSSARPCFSMERKD